MKIIFCLAWRNLWRHPRRTWLTTGAMLFSNVLLVFMISFQFGTYDLMINNTLQAFTGHMQVQAPGYKDDHKMRQLVRGAESLAQKIRTDTGLDTVAVRGEAFGLASSEDRSFGIRVIGVQPEFETRVSTIPGLVKDGRFLGDNAAAEIVVGGVLARNLKISLGDEITLLGSGPDGSFAAGVAVLVGIFESGVADIDRSIAEIPLGYFQDTFYMQDAAHAIVINAPELALQDVTFATIQPMIPQDGSVVLHDWNALQPGLKQAIQADMSSAFFMYGILVILVAFSVLNTQLMSVLERTREFGIMMSLGLRPGKLGRLVMLETALMGLIGLTLGALLGSLLTLWFTFNGLTIPGMEDMAMQFNLPSRIYPVPTAMTVMLGPATVFAFTLVAAVYPALRLHRLQPVEAMRSA